jgi:hypothetical protein
VKLRCGLRKSCFAAWQLHFSAVAHSCSDRSWPAEQRRPHHPHQLTQQVTPPAAPYATHAGVAYGSTPDCTSTTTRRTCAQTTRAC